MREQIFDILNNLNIDYKNYEHEAVFSCSETKGIYVPGKRCKSLLIRNKKGTNFYMVVLEENKKLDTNILRDFFQDSKMSFFEEELMIQKVNLRPGSISPFALVNNKEKDIKVVFDIELQNTTIGFHPLQNDNTVVLNMKDVELFLDNVGNEFLYLQL